MMPRILYIGMDVHKESYTLCNYEQANGQVRDYVRMEPEIKHVLNYLMRLRDKTKEEVRFVCGYEAGALGYTLYHQLTKCGVECVILAPSTMLLPTKRRVKTDKRDAENIARCLAYGTYSAVHVPTAQDGQVKEYIRMRDSMKRSLKATKQQILALVLRQGFRYNEGVSNWTQRHLAWLRMLKMEGAMQEALTEYLIQYDYMANKLERIDGRIEELANSDRYRENVKKLTCLTGIKTLTALTTIVEVGDFNRFARAQNFASFLGLVPGEHSSGDKQVRMGITKAGNIHLRRLLVEAAQSHTRGVIGHKSKVLKRRQAGNPPPLIAYADRANERLRRKFYRMTLQNQSKRNVAATAIARELACFIWGMMTDRIS